MKTTTLAMLAAVLPLVSAGCATRTTETVAAPPPTVVTTPGSGSVVVAASPATTGTTRISGRVTDVDRDGDIKVKTADGKKFEIRVPAATAATVHEGDQVTLDVTFSR